MNQPEETLRRRYGWHRFCAQLNAKVKFEEGFLVDPATTWGSLANPQAKTLADIADERCVVLLGEPGLGKTTTLRDETLRLGETGETAHGIDLGAYESEAALETALFSSEVWRRWQTGTGRLTLMLDAFDESPLRTQTLGRLLVEGLHRGDSQRLALRIACRHGRWPPGLDEALATRLGISARSVVYKLLPLRAVDCETAAAAWGLDGGRFVGELINRDLGPLASIPATLELLLRTYVREGRLPEAPSEIYRIGLRALCEEPDPGRRHQLEREGGPARPTAEQLLQVAARIATFTVLGGHAAVCRWTVLEEAAGDLSLQSISGGHEKVLDATVQVDERILRECLYSGLFAPLGGERYRWSHRTFGEFLTGLYLVPRPLEQLRGLLLRADDQGSYVISQLREVAAWLVELRPEVFELLLPSDPFVVLKGSARLGDGERARLVDSVLERVDEMSWDEYWELRRRFRNLRHPGLAGQLDPVLRDRAAPALRRRVALEISEACALRDLENVWVMLALDAAEPEDVRIEAAGAVVRAGSETAKATLAPLARGQAGPDPNDELRGLGLSAVFPGHWTSAEVLRHLPPRQNEALFGVYCLFLRQFPSKVAPRDLPALLEATATWIDRDETRQGRMRALVDEALPRAWELLDEPGVAPGLAKLLVALVRRYQGPVDEEEAVAQARARACTDAGTRRRFLTLLLNDTDVTPFEVFCLRPAGWVLQAEDALWVFQNAERAPADREAAWVECAEMAVRAFDQPEAWDYVSQLSPDRGALWGAFGRYTGAIPLDSPEAQGQRVRRAERARREAEQRSASEAAGECLLRALDRSEGGDPLGWLEVIRTLEVGMDGGVKRDGFERSPAALGRWQAADPRTQERILDAARRYLVNPPEVGTEYLRSGRIPRDACGTYQAVRLLFDREPRFLLDLPGDRWTPIAPAVVGWPAWGRDPHAGLVRLAYQKAPGAVLALLPDLVQHTDCLRDLVGAWDARLADALADLLRTETLSPRQFFEVAEHLLVHEHAGARALLEQLCRREPPPDLTPAVHLPDGFVLLVKHHPEEWRVLWPRLAANPPMALSVLQRLTRSDDLRAAVMEALSERDLAELYVWLCEQIGTTPDELPVGAMRQVTEESWLAGLRDSLPRILAARGTREAVAQLVAIKGRLPGQAEILDEHLRAARRATRLQSWPGLGTAELRALLTKEESRYVGSADELMRAVLESLGRFQTFMQGPLSPVDRLWCYDGGGTHRANFRPKDEEAISDEIARWLGRDLRERGIVVNREVQVRRGHRTDIYVDAISPREAGAIDLFTTVIEVKGCWNRELFAAMETQLVRGYLVGSGLRHGIYVVGWFLGGRWDNDRRREATPNEPAREVQRRLVEEARTLNAADPALRLEALVLDLAYPP